MSGNPRRALRVFGALALPVAIALAACQPAGGSSPSASEVMMASPSEAMMASPSEVMMASPSEAMMEASPSEAMMEGSASP